MSRAPGLSPAEQKTILIMRGEGYFYREIAQKLGRKIGIIGNFLRSPMKYLSKMSTARPKIMGKGDLVRVHRLFSQQSLSLGVVVNGVNLQVSRMTLWRALWRKHRFKHMQMLRTMDLTSTQSLMLRGLWSGRRLIGAMKIVESRWPRWLRTRVDEYKELKKDLRRSPQWWLRCYSVSVISSEGKSNLSIIERTVNAEGYIKELENIWYLLVQRISITPTWLCTIMNRCTVLMLLIHF